MSSSTGSQYYTKSMNGVISFDDGNGTTIEDDAIITSDITCTTLTATSNINSGTIYTDFIFNNANPTLQIYPPVVFYDTVKASFVPTNSNDLCNKLYVDTITTGTILALTNVFTGTMNTFNNKIKVSNITYDYNSIVSANPVQPVSLFNTTTGIISLGPIIEIKNGSIAATGTNKLYVGDSNGDVIIANGRTSGVGKSLTLGSGVQIIANGEILCENGIQLDALTNYIDCKSTATIDVFKTLSTGIINFCNTITTATINMCNSFIFKQNSIASLNIADSINLFNNISGATGSVNMCNSLIFKQYTIASVLDNAPYFLFNNVKGNDASINMCNNSIIIRENEIKTSDFGTVINLFNNLTTGSINMATNLILKQSAIISSAVGDVINLFTNLTTGTLNIATGLTTGILNIATGMTTGRVNIGSALTTGDIFIGNINGTTTGALGDISMGNDTNNSSSAGNGTVRIYKLRIGNSPVLRNIRYGSVAGGSSNASFNFAPAFPSGQVPFIVGTIQSNANNRAYSIAFTGVTNTSCTYNKYYIASTGGFNAAVTESFHYYAFSD